VRTEILKGLGGARSFFVVGEDLDLQLRVGEETRVWYSPDPLYFYRLHDSSITHTMHSHEREYYERQAQAFQIQRKRFGADDLQLGRPPKRLDSQSNEVGSASIQLQNLLIGKSWVAFEAGDRRGAVKFALQAVHVAPTSWRVWRNLIVALVKVPL
jgi:hypothetical protein